MGKPSKAVKKYVEIDSEEKKYVNREIIANQLLNGQAEYDGGYVILLDGPDLLTTTTLVHRGVPPSRIIVVERCEETYETQSERLCSLGAMDHIHICDDIDNIFGYPDDTTEVDALIFDGMTCYCDSDLLQKFIAWPGKDKKLWYTITIRNKAGKMSTALTGQVKRCVSRASNKALSLKIHHGYRRSKNSNTVVVLYFTEWCEKPFYRHIPLNRYKYRKSTDQYETKIVGIKKNQFCHTWQCYNIPELIRE